MIPNCSSLSLLCSFHSLPQIHNTACIHFLKIGAIIRSLHSSGICSCSYIFRNRSNNISITTPSSTNQFHTSPGIPPVPIAVPLFILFSAIYTSFLFIFSVKVKDPVAYFFGEIFYDEYTKLLPIVISTLSDQLT